MFIKKVTGRPLSMGRLTTILLICCLGVVPPSLAKKPSPEPTEVQISNLQDTNFGNVTPDGTDLRIDDYVCIYSSNTKKYAITATGLHDAGGNFYMANGGSFVRYTVKWKGTQGGFKLIAPGVKQGNLKKPSDKLFCTGEPVTKFATLRIEILGAWILAVPAGHYTDTLTLLLEPN